MTVYFNEHDRFPAQWLRNLWPDAVVDERSVVDVKAADVARHERVHLFGGIGGWEYALALAGWAGPVWTGSCPCQPFSTAGKRKGTADHRHLWPEMFRLIRECRPDTIFGEQVAGGAATQWIDGVFSDLEGEGYACGAAVLGAHSVSAPHIRRRFYWVAHRNRQPRQQISGGASGHEGENGGRAERDNGPSGHGKILRIPNTIEQRRARVSGVWEKRVTEHRPWDNFEPIRFKDGKTRRIEPGAVPLAHGVPKRVELIRGYGNAIVPQVAATFVRAFMDGYKS